MVSRRGDLLPAGCRGSFSRQPRSENGGGGTVGFPRNSLLVSGFLPRGGLIGEGGPRGATQGSQEGAWRAPPSGPRQLPSWLAGSGPGAPSWLFWSLPSRGFFIYFLWN